MSVDEYRSRFGLPWSRGLTSAASVASSGWTDERKAKARKLARKNRFFERAHLTRRQAALVVTGVKVHPDDLARVVDAACIRAAGAKRIVEGGEGPPAVEEAFPVEI